MPNNTKSFTNSINKTSSDDALSQVLNAMRISGSILLQENYKAPWSVSVPDSNSLNKLLKTNSNTRIAAFHLVEEGHINIKLENGEDTLVKAGEMIICFSGLGHTLYQGNGGEIIPFEEIMKDDNNIFRPDEGEQSPCTSLVCGVFLFMTQC